MTSKETPDSSAELSMGTTSSSTRTMPEVTLSNLKMIQSLIERCLLSYMSKEDVVNHLYNQAHIDPVLTRIVWDKLEEANKEFFQAYSIRVKIREQIEAFNFLIMNQTHLIQRICQQLNSFPSQPSDSREPQPLTPQESNTSTQYQESNTNNPQQSMPSISPTTMPSPSSSSSCPVNEQQRSQ
jgi:uncharacterized protein (TIGR01589 family)